MSEKKEKILFSAEIKARELTNPEIRAMRKAGVHLHYTANPSKIVEDFTDYVLDNIYPEIDFSKTSQRDCLKFASETFERTYAKEEEIKN